MSLSSCRVDRADDPGRAIHHDAVGSNLLTVDGFLQRRLDLGTLAFGFGTSFPKNLACWPDRELKGDSILHVLADQDRRIDPPKLDLFVASALHHRACDDLIGH